MELCFFTLAVGGHRPPLLVAGLAHPDRPAAPASLRHRHPVAGARVAEALAARPAVVLPLRLLEHFPTAVTNLRWGRGRWEGGGMDSETWTHYYGKRESISVSTRARFPFKL